MEDSDKFFIILIRICIIALFFCASGIKAQEFRTAVQFLDGGGVDLLAFSYVYIIFLLCYISAKKPKEEGYTPDYVLAVKSFLWMVVITAGVNFLILHAGGFVTGQVRGGVNQVRMTAGEISLFVQQGVYLAIAATQILALLQKRENE